MKGTTPPSHGGGGGGDECQSSLSSSSYSSLSTHSRSSNYNRNKKKKQTLFVVDDNDELSISQVISPCLSCNISPLLQPAAVFSSSSAASSSSSPLAAREVSVTTRTKQKETLLFKQHQQPTFESNNTGTILSSNNKQSSLSLFASSLLFGSTANNDEFEDVMLSSHDNTTNCNDDDVIVDNDSENLTTSLSSNTSAAGGDKSTSQHKYGKMALFYRSILGQSSTPSTDRSCLISICILLLVTILVAGPTIIIVRTNNRSVVVETTTTTTTTTTTITPTTTNNNPMRWYDTGNCLPNYRLANSTTSIYCNGVLDIETIQYYCQGLSMEPNHCTMSSSGYWSRSSIIDDNDDDSNTKAMTTQQNIPNKFGLHDHHIDTDSSITTIPQRYCQTMEDVVNGGAYTGNDLYNQEWTPQSCSLIPVSPFEWTRDTQCQTTIIMMGDQHIRNLFTATINGLRGIDAFIESHENKHAKARGIAESYYWRLHFNGTATDQFNEHIDTFASDADLFEDCSCGNNNNNNTEDKNEVQRCLRIAFIWAPMFDDQLRQLHIVINEQSDIVIVSPGNSAEVTNVLPDEWMAAYQLLLDGYDYVQLGIVHYPFGPQPTKERETILTNWTTNNIHASRISVLNQHDMKHKPTTTNKMTKFACGLGKVNIANDNIIAFRPCTDVTDTAQMRALITVHLDALVGH